MIGVSRVAGTLLCHHLAGDPGQIVVAPSIGPRSSVHERCRVCYMCVIFPRNFKRIFVKHLKNVTQYDVGVSSS